MRAVPTDFFPPDDGGFPDPGLGGVGQAFPVVFGIVGFIVVAVFVFVIVVAVRKYAVLKKAGHDPFTVDAALAVKVLDSAALAPAPATAGVPDASREQRLAELDDLHARGVISAEERAAARASILAG